MLETLCYLPMLLTGMSTQKQQLSVTFHDTHEEDPVSLLIKYCKTLNAFNCAVSLIFNIHEI